MSLLSQFFPSGGTQTQSATVGDISKGLPTDYSKQIPIDLLVIGGGGGGGGYGGPVTVAPNGPSVLLCGMLGGGGGGGRIVAYTNAIVNTGTPYPIVVGGGGAQNSVGGNSCFGAVYAGGGSGGSGLDPLLNPVTGGSNPSIQWGGSAGGQALLSLASPAAYSPIAFSSPSSAGRFQLNYPVAAYFYNGSVVSPVTSKPSFTPGYSCKYFFPIDSPLDITWGSAGSYNYGTITADYGAGIGTITDVKAPFFSNWSLNSSSYIGPTTGGAGAGSYIYGMSIPAIGSGFYMRPSAAPFGYPNWPGTPGFDIRPVGACINSMPNYVLCFTTPGGTRYATINSSTPTMTISCGTLQTPLGPGPAQLAANLPLYSGPNNFPINASPKVFTSSCCPNMSGAPGTGSGGSGGLYTRPAAPISSTITTNNFICFFSTPGPGRVPYAVTYPYQTSCPYTIDFQTNNISGGAGGSGSVWVIYPTDYAAATVTGNTPVPSPPNLRIYRWDSAGTITFN